jgi:signal transduction histidine kinase/ligand-binding sensor domain-containing protein/AraC-like DNA-binding protein
MLFGNTNRNLPAVWLIFGMHALLAFPLSAQSPVELEWEYFGPDEGVGMSFLDIIQDHKGFIWAGSTNGLYRYDGYKPLPFKKYTNKLTGLSSDWVWDLEEDAQGNIWIATYDGGINMWERASGKFTHYRHNRDDPNSLRSNNVLKILIDQAGDVWAVVKNKDGAPALDKLNPSTGKVTRYRHDPADPRSLSCDTVSVTAFQAMQLHPLCAAPDGGVWVATHKGLNLYERKSEGFRRFSHEPGNPQSLSFDKVIAVEPFRNEEGVFLVRTASPDLKQIAIDRLDVKTGAVSRIRSSDGEAPAWGVHFPTGKEEAWISNTSLAQYRIGATLEKQKEISFPKPKTAGIFAHSGGSLFLPVKGADPLKGIRGADNYNVENGFFFFSPEDGEVKYIDRNPLNRALPFEEVYCFLEDRSGLVWIGSARGVYKLKIRGSGKGDKPVFENYFPSGGQGLTSTDIRDVWEENPDVFWPATFEGGLNRLDRRTGKVLSFTHDPSAPHSITDNNLYSLWFDQTSNHLWIGHEKGIDILDLNAFSPDRPASAKFRRLSHPSGLLDGRINEIEPDGKGNLWIGTADKGLLLISPDGEKILHRIIFDDLNPDPAHSSFINKVFTDSRGRTWVAPGMGGLCELIQQGDSFRRNCHMDGLFIVDFLERPDGHLWCAAMNYGLLKFNPDGGLYELISMENRLARNSVTGIEEDSLGRIWFTSIGLTRYNPRNDTYKTFGRDAGVIGLDPERCFFKSRSGELFYAAPHSALQIFTPENVIDNPTPPKVAFTDFKLFNESVLHGKNSPLKESIETASAIYLKHDQHSFSLEFVGLEFTRSRDNLYRYKLEGIDADWVFSGAHREARYTSIAPGRYRFLVIAANSDGIWSENPASIEIIISPPWWKKWWAYALFIVVGFGAAFYFYRFQVNRKLAQEEARRLKEIDSLKTRLYTNISHEFRTPLTVILGMAEQAVQNPERWFREGLKMIIRNGRNLLTLVNQMLDLRKIESGAMSVNYSLGDVVAYLRYVSESFHSYAKSKNIGLYFSSSLAQYVIDYDEDKLLKITTNLVSNAVKFTPEGGSVYIAVEGIKDEEGKEMLEITVKDTGVGIPTDKLPRIFDRFYQADDSPTRRGEGLGIGLALTQELVKLLKGSITVQSPLYQGGRGSEFCVRLPVTRAATAVHDFHAESLERGAVDLAGAEPGTQRGAPLLKGDCKGKPLVLIIEDNKDVVRYLAACLEDEYCLLAAYDGKAGLETAFERIPDIIICDVMMPELDGFEATATLKEDIRTSHIPIIMLTALATAEDRIAGLERGADAYLAKPFNREELLVSMKKMIELRKRLQERYAALHTDGKPATHPFEAEDPLIEQIRALVEARIDDPDFGPDEISKALYLSRSQIHRKMKALTGHAVVHFIRTVRLQRALHLLQTTDKSVTEIAMDVGFTDPSYFSRIFAAWYGEAPSKAR